MATIMIPLYKPHMPPLPELEEILYSGQLAYGSYTKCFEDALRSYFDTPYLMTTNSFNMAISVVLTALGLDCGDEIIASPMGCLGSTQPLLTMGLTVRWADVDPYTGTLCPNHVRKRITGKTKAIFHNHFCGYPGRIDEINAIGKGNGIPVIDDGIECFGSIYKGKKIGICGSEATVFSLSAVRNPNTIDGGIAIFRDSGTYEKALLIRDCGIDRTRFRDDIGEINPACDITLKGYSATMSNINGYIGLKQMECIEDILTKSRTNAACWCERLRGVRGIKPLPGISEGVPNYWVFGLLVEDKDSAVTRFRDAGFYASGVHINNSLYSTFGSPDCVLSGADKFYHNFMGLPCGWWVDANDILKSHIKEE